MNKKKLLHATQELIRDLCILADNNVVISRDRFHDACEKEQLIELILIDHGNSLKLDYFKKTSPLRNEEAINYINDAFCRYANAETMEDYGLKNNSIFFAINIAVKIIDEVEAIPETSECAA